MNSSKQLPQTDQKLNDLITALSEGERTTFNDIIRSANLPKSAFEEYSSWSNECYTRNCIIENEKFELILLCWEKGQMTPIHDHGGEECWVKIIKGEFKETIYNADKNEGLSVIKSFISKPNDISYMIDFMGFHSIENLSNQRSMSLHLYAKPIRNCNIFDEESKQFLRKNLAYDTLCPNN